MVFSKDLFGESLARKKWNHVVYLELGAQPMDCKVYPLTPEGQKELDTFLKENLESGHIHESKSPMMSPFFIRQKKDGKL